MKTNILVTLLFSLVSLYSFGQWHISPTLGLNMVPLKENDAAGTTFKLGPSIGIHTGTTFWENWDLDIGLTANRRFSQYYSKEETGELDVFIDLIGGGLGGILGPLGDDVFKTYETTEGYTHYWTIDLPITMAYRLNSGFHFFVGPYVNYMISIENRETVTKEVPLFDFIDLNSLGLPSNITSLLPTSGEEQSFNNSKEDINDYDYGVLGGVGYTGKHWILKMAYQYGFMDFRKDNKYVGTNNAQALNLSIGYLFNSNTETSNLKPRYDLDLIK